MCACLPVRLSLACVIALNSQLLFAATVCVTSDDIQQHAQTHRTATALPLSDWDALGRKRYRNPGENVDHGWRNEVRTGRAPWALLPLAAPQQPLLHSTHAQGPAAGDGGHMRFASARGRGGSGGGMGARWRWQSRAWWRGWRPVHRALSSLMEQA